MKPRVIVVPHQGLIRGYWDYEAWLEDNIKHSMTPTCLQSLCLWAWSSTLSNNANMRITIGRGVDCTFQGKASLGEAAIYVLDCPSQ